MNPTTLVARWATVIIVVGLLATACATTPLELPADTTAPTAPPATEAPTVTTTDPPPDSEPPPTTTEEPPPEVPDMPTFDDDDDDLPIDDDVRIGTLDNGLSYYIRSNQRPGGRAQVHLAVNAGSALEDDDQRGGAHFLEHMMFNGTENFPANELIRVLERFGAEFGPDVNAYTSYDETVYQLAIPTDDDEIVTTAFDVLLEWASRATIDPDEVEAERGVVIEEWRLRDQGFWSRYFDEVTDRLLSDTPYDDRSPIGGLEPVTDMTPEALRRYYEDWYRPDLMAVVVVGDIDVDETEAEIIERFAPLTNPEEAPERPEITTTAATEPTFIRLADPEYPSSFAELNYPLPVTPTDTVGALRRELALQVGFDIVATRLSDDARRGGTPFFSASAASNPLVRSQQSPGVATENDPADLAAATRAALEEVERARRYGFTEEELERSLAALRSSVEQEFDRRSTRQDRQLADEYVANFLSGDPIPSARDRFDLLTQLLDDMTVDQVWGTFAAILDTTEPLVIVAGPEADDDDIPTIDELEALLDDVVNGEVDRRESDAEAVDAIMGRPDPAAIDETSSIDDLDATVIELANGATVVMKETTIAADTVVFSATSPGGWSVVDDEDIIEAQLAPAMVANSGVGDLDAVQLERLLSGANVQVSPVIDQTFEGFDGEAATGDLEELFQLVNRFMTAPRLDPSAVDATIGQILPLAEDPTQVPDLAQTIALIRARYGDGSYLEPIPDVAGIESFDPDRALEVFADRFADASDFIFVFSGDFDTDDVTDLAQRYLGTLASTDSFEAYVDRTADEPEGIVEETVEAGQDDQGNVAMLFSVEREIDLRTEIITELTGAIVTQRLTDRIREELAATYSPVAILQPSIEPDEELIAFLQISGDPERLDEIIDAVIADVGDLGTEGPTADQLAIVKEQLRREYELFSNEFWVSTLAFYAANPEEDPGAVWDRPDIVDGVTAADIQALAAELLTVDNYIVVKRIPVS